MTVQPRAAALAVGLALAATTLAPAAVAQAAPAKAWYCTYDVSAGYPVTGWRQTIEPEIDQLAVPGAFVVRGATVTVLASTTAEPTEEGCVKLGLATLPGYVLAADNNVATPYVTAMTCVMDTKTGKNVQTMPLPWQAKPGTAEPRFRSAGGLAA